MYFSYIFYGDHVETHAIDDAIVAINAVIVASSAAEASSKWELAPFEVGAEDGVVVVVKAALFLFQVSSQFMCRS